MYKSIKSLITSILLLAVFSSSLLSFIKTKDAILVERDKFNFRIGILEYFRDTIGSVFEIPLVIQLGLAKRVEFYGVIPYILLRHSEIRMNTGTMGDFLIFLKFDIKKFNYFCPFFPEDPFWKVKNQLTLIIGFNTATGISKETGSEGKYFTPYSIGLPDFRIGLLYSKTIKDLLINLDFVYTFAPQPGEDYLPFSDKFWSSKDKIYLFGIVNVLVKFLWPGKYPFASAAAEEWEKYPHIDDYFHFNTGFKLNLEPDWLFFPYDLFTSFNWVNSWSKYSDFPSYLLVTPGIEAHLTETISLLGGVSFLIAEAVYQTDTIEKARRVDETSDQLEELITEEIRRDFYFNNLYYIGIKFLL